MRSAHHSHLEQHRPAPQESKPLENGRGPQYWPVASVVSAASSSRNNALGALIGLAGRHAAAQPKCFLHENVSSEVGVLMCQCGERKRSVTTVRPLDSHWH